MTFIMLANLILWTQANYNFISASLMVYLLKTILFSTQNYIVHCKLHVSFVPWTPLLHFFAPWLKMKRGALKVAEHSFSTRFCWCNSARAQVLQKRNMPSIERSFNLLNTRTVCAIFLYNWTQCIDGFSLLSQRYVRKGNDAKNPAILSFFFIAERTQLNAAHA